MGDVHSYQLRSLKGLTQEEKHPFGTTVECESLSLFDNNQFLINYLKHLIQTHTSILHASPTPALSSHHARHLRDFSISYLLAPQSDEGVVRSYYSKSARRHDQTSGLIEKK